MLIVLANRSDAAARLLAQRWTDTVFLSPQYLSGRGWCHELGGRRSKQQVELHESISIGGLPISAAQIDGVYTRISGVFEHDLIEIRAEDRAYVAAEMNAFLLSWLTNLRCRVVNRPTFQGLCGPNLRPEAWIHIAAMHGIPVVTILRDSNGYQSRDVKLTEQVTIVGDHAFGYSEIRARQWARELAECVGLDLVTVSFNITATGPLFLEASPWLDLSGPGIEDAVLDLLRNGRSSAPEESK